MNSTYSEHKHQANELLVCLKRISEEEHKESEQDRLIAQEILKHSAKYFWTDLWFTMVANSFSCSCSIQIDQLPYIKIQPDAIDLNTSLRGRNPTHSVVIPQSLILRSIA